jgi:hypothetical protein
MLGMSPRYHVALRMGVVLVFAAGVLSAATSALGGEGGARPNPGQFKGSFAGTGLGRIQFDVFPVGPTPPRVGVRWFGGFVPGVCVKPGMTQVFGIQFDSHHSGLRVRPRSTEIPASGAFVFRLVHSADVFNGDSYSVTVRGTFGRKTVSGRVQGTGTDPLSGKCRANRTFTARLARG